MAHRLTGGSGSLIARCRRLDQGRAAQRTDLWCIVILQQIVIGGVIVGAVLVDTLLKRQRV